MKYLTLSLFALTALFSNASHACSLDFEGMQADVKKAIVKKLQLPSNTPIDFVDSIANFEADPTGKVLVESVIWNEFGGDGGGMCPDEIIEVFSIETHLGNKICSALLQFKHYRNRAKLLYKKCDTYRNE